jgi:hypothetical protein
VIGIQLADVVVELVERPVPEAVCLVGERRQVLFELPPRVQFAFTESVIPRAGLDHCAEQDANSAKVGDHRLQVGDGTLRQFCRWRVHAAALRPPAFRRRLVFLALASQPSQIALLTRSRAKAMSCVASPRKAISSRR